MELSEFIQDFAENHSVQHIDDVNGVIIQSITDELYLVRNTV